GKPVPVNPYRLRTAPRSGMAIVAAAGPLSNLITAGLVSLLFRLGIIEFHSLSTISLSSIFSTFILYIILYNLILAIFNLMPIAPLDGFKIAVGILPRNWAISLAKTERYGPMILLIVIVLSFYTDILWNVIGGGVNFFSNIFLGGDLI
ncbi:MAG: site-2 protease family protein, partial [Chloroflexota bacterium]|nr:site-2 protease family protein [Chloroflexota bacterium]